jgi:uncharacterized protein DUF3592
MWEELWKGFIVVSLSAGAVGSTVAGVRALVMDRKYVRAAIETDATVVRVEVDDSGEARELVPVVRYFVDGDCTESRLLTMSPWVWHAHLEIGRETRVSRLPGNPRKGVLHPTNARYYLWEGVGLIVAGALMGCGSIWLEFINQPPFV